MSEIKALDELRKLGEKVKNSCFTCVNCDVVIELADAIEAEIAERFVELPVGDDGEALEIGDELECLGKKVLLNSLIWDGKDWFATEIVISSMWHEACNCRHVKSLEDVLRECAEAYASGADVELGSTDAMFSKYADEIRGLLGGGAR